MHAYDLALAAAAIALYALVSRRLRTTAITGPMVFVALGVVLGKSNLDRLGPAANPHLFTATFEATLVLVLFTDAMAVNAAAWRSEIKLPGRLLGIGLPLTIVAGWALAAAMFGGLDVWEAALVGAVMAPTDAALGQAVVSNPRVPERIRQGLNIESGLNDGIVLPILTVFLALAEHQSGGSVATVFFKALVLAAVIGVAIGWVGGKGLLWARRHGWTSSAWQQVFVLAAAVLCYALASPVGGSGFIAAWAGGCAMGITIRNSVPQVAELSEDLASLLTIVSFLLFGALYLGPTLSELTVPIVLYAIASLTLVRMIPVAVSLVRSGLARPSVAYLGWFGPRGLATIVFADILVEHALPGTPLITAIVNTTVGLSVLAHGATSWAGSERYGSWYERRVKATPQMAESGRVGHLGARRRLQPR